MKFLGAPYPIVKHPNGLLHTQNGINQIKSDLLVLLLTTPGERVMLPDYGTPLKELIFEPNDSTVAERAREMIIESITTWEPRITVQNIFVTNEIDSNDLNKDDSGEEVPHILNIKIEFFDPEDINDVQELRLELPLIES